MKPESKHFGVLYYNFNYGGYHVKTRFSGVYPIREEQQLDCIGCVGKKVEYVKILENTIVKAKIKKWDLRKSNFEEFYDNY